MAIGCCYLCVYRVWSTNRSYIRSYRDIGYLLAVISRNGRLGSGFSGTCLNSSLILFTFISFACAASLLSPEYKFVACAQQVSGSEANYNCYGDSSYCNDATSCAESDSLSPGDCDCYTGTGNCIIINNMIENSTCNPIVKTFPMLVKIMVAISAVNIILTILAAAAICRVAVPEPPGGAIPASFVINPEHTHVNTELSETRGY